MVIITERYGVWRGKEAVREVRSQKRLSTQQKEQIIKCTAWKNGRETMQYWGLDYGMLLGLTFAAMHRERFSRVVLDGVLEPEDHYTGTRFKKLQDSDKTITKFCEYCHETGPEKCPLYTGTSGADVEARLTKVMMNLKTDPIAVAIPGRGPELVGYSDMVL